MLRLHPTMRMFALTFPFVVPSQNLWADESNETKVIGFSNSLESHLSGGELTAVAYRSNEFQKVGSDYVCKERKADGDKKLTASARPTYAKNDGSPVGLANPALAMGIGAPEDWSTQHPYIDLMKTARRWFGSNELTGDYVSASDIEAASQLDENGWPTEFPDGVTHLDTVILADQPSTASNAIGRYRLTYEGDGELFVSGLAEIVSEEPNEIWFDYNLGQGHVYISITATAPGNHIRNISIVKENLIPYFEAGVVFNPSWIERISDLRGIRFMDWMKTNGSQISSWESRPGIGDYSYSRRGVPFEHLIALANRIGADPWFNMPHLADDDFVRSFAELVKENADPRLRISVEYSNELWNFGMTQAQWALEKAEDIWGNAARGDAWIQYTSGRASEMMQIWTDVFGQEANQRLVRVLGIQTGWIGLENVMLEAPLWREYGDGGKNRPADYFDAIAVTGYFGYELGTSKTEPALRSWLAESSSIARYDADELGLVGADHTNYIADHKFDFAVQQATRFLKADVEERLLGEILVSHATTARQFGLSLVMYEGGTHVVGHETLMEDEELTEFFVHLNYSDEMGALYETLLKGWSEISAAPFMAYVDVGKPSKYGSWGGLRHVADENPRWDALMNFNREAPVWADERDPSAFLHGITAEGSAGPDILAGTTEEDVLIGHAGNDIFQVFGGSDNIHGGSGQDLVILPGHREQYEFVVDGDLMHVISENWTTIMKSVELIRFEGDPETTHPATVF